tara:strand:- start:9328 stop:10740 length:1413 start_codon:yes stop_codon:yes gene_type:complete
MTKAGRTNQTPDALNQQIIDAATALSPGLTANLPGSLIEDISSTETAAALVSDAAVTELINSITPYGANPFLLNQLGVLYLGALNGVQGGTSTNSVNVVISGPAGFLIAEGFTVSDGTYQYVVQDGGIIGSGGQSPSLYCLATQSGSWAIPANSVTQIATSVPSGIALTVTNPTTGTPGAQAETEEAYRARVLMAGIASAEGMATFLKTQLRKVSGVQARLVSVRQITGGGWEVICGGGDPYQVAYQIYSALFDVSTLTGSVLSVESITKANPGVVTTDLNHGFSNGQVINIAGVVGMTEVNNTPLTVTVLTEKTFSIGNTSTFGNYVTGGVVTPNLRNQLVSINDYPDTYVIPYVIPPQQIVTLSLTWNTSSTNFISPAAVAQLGTPALVSYINSIPVGAPINVFELQNAFQEAIVSVVPTPLLTRMVFSVSINGIGVSPSPGTGIIAGDPESYFFTNESGTGITITQG